MTIINRKATKVRKVVVMVDNQVAEIVGINREAAAFGEAVAGWSARLQVTVRGSQLTIEKWAASTRLLGTALTESAMLLLSSTEMRLMSAQRWSALTDLPLISLMTEQRLM